MTNKARITAHVKDILAGSQDLVLVGRMLVLKPVRHILRAVMIDRTRFPETVRPRWFVDPLFLPKQYIRMSCGGDLNSDPLAGWELSQTDFAAVLRREVETVALPALRSVESIDDYVKVAMGHWARHNLYDNPTRGAVLDAVLGNQSGLREKCARRRQSGAYDDLPDSVRHEVEEVARLCELVEKSDASGVTSLLHEWERVNVTRLKLTPYWEPSPFPVEVRPAGA